MRAFFALARTALRQQMQYRSAAVAGVATQLAFGLLYVSVFQAFYASGGGQADLTLSQAVSYVWLSQGAYRMMPWSGLRDIEAMLRDGRIAFELARPRDLYSMWYGRAMALRTAPLLINLPLLLLIALLLPGDFRLRLALPLLPLGALSLGLGMLVSAAMTAILTGTYFWTLSGQGINRIVPLIGSFLAGNILPLGFLPAGLRDALRLLPFASMLDGPMRILVGAVDVRTALWTVALQALWLLALGAIGRAVVRAGARKCMVQGG
ncbi:MAG: ABC transporter permease [Candidatus Spyradocola sp.]|jgi:ABC-2 type transport system permease protein